jgi:glycosyltransferase involved in cell wall biosynthesis
MGWRICCLPTAFAGAETFLMNEPLVSVVIETINARYNAEPGSLPQNLAATMEGLNQQTYPGQRIERIIVLDAEVAGAEADEISRRWPEAKLVSSLACNYFAAKNVGAAAANGEIIALLDSDSVPQPTWLEMLVTRFQPGVAAVGGRSRYRETSFSARIFRVPHFAYVLAEKNGAASGFNIHNVAFRRDVLLSHPFETRIRRDGACYLLFHQLRAEGATILHEPRALAYHGLEFHGFGFARKHFNRGYDGVAVYRLDHRGVLRGTSWLRRFGAAGLVAITARRILRDWWRMLLHRRQIEINLMSLPYFFILAVIIRTIELAGGVTATIKSKPPRYET